MYEKSKIFGAPRDRCYVDVSYPAVCANQIAQGCVGHFQVHHTFDLTQATNRAKAFSRVSAGFNRSDKNNDSTQITITDVSGSTGDFAERNAIQNGTPETNTGTIDGRLDKETLHYL
jgi:hypothetical protein